MPEQSPSPEQTEQAVPLEQKSWLATLNYFVTKVIIILSVAVLIYIAWQLTWKAVTPDSLIRFLPAKETVLAVEQYGHSSLPIVRASQQLAQLDPQQFWPIQSYPSAVQQRIKQLQPKRLLQSWQLFDGQRQPLLIVETSLRDYQGQNQAIASFTVGEGEWYLQQFQPGLYYFTDSEAVLPQIGDVRLANQASFVEIQQNSPDQYFAAGYINPQLWQVQPSTPPLISFVSNEILKQLGPTYLTLTPTKQGFNLLTYTTTPDPEQKFRHNQHKFAANLTRYLSAQPQFYFGGRELSQRYGQFLHQLDFAQITAGLKLPVDSRQLLQTLLNKEVAYAEYPSRIRPRDQVFLLASTTESNYNKLLELLLPVHNYLNPQRTRFQLRDGSFGYKLVARELDQLPEQHYRNHKFPYLKGPDQTWYFAYRAADQLVLASTSLIRLANLIEPQLTSFKTSSIYYDNILPVLRSSDELTYIDNAKLKALWPELQLFDQVDSITFSKNFFPDGLQTYNLIKLKPTP